MSGLGDPFDALCADGRRPLPPWWVIRMSALGVPRDGFCLYGGASTPVRLGDQDVGSMGDPLAGLPVHTHTGGIPGTARAKQSNEHQYSGKFSLGGLHSPSDIRSPHPGCGGTREAEANGNKRPTISTVEHRSAGSAQKGLSVGVDGATS